MQIGLTSIFRFLDKTTPGPLVLVTITKTVGASYRKAGAMMLIDPQLRSSGLVSGGCLEDDLKSHAQSVFETRAAKTVVYDLSAEESASLWGLGLGCGGEITVLLELVSPANQYGGLTAVRKHWQAGTPCGLVKIVAHIDERQVGRYTVCPPGEAMAPEFGMGRFEMSDVAVIAGLPDAQILAIPVSPALRLLVCGGGPDAIPLVHLANELFWLVTVADHRPAYLTADHFPGAARLLCVAPEAVPPEALAHLHAAVVMTHNVAHDTAWLKILGDCKLPYLGILGPTARRDALVAAAQLPPGLHVYGPAGLDLGAVLPEEIALAILAELHAVINGRNGASLSSLSGRSG